jgi:hypothetical protein
LLAWQTSAVWPRVHIDRLSSLTCQVGRSQRLVRSWSEDVAESARQESVHASAEASVAIGVTLPVFYDFSDAMQRAGPNATVHAPPPLVLINNTDHLEIRAFPDPAQVSSSSPVSPQTALIEVTRWRDTSNRLGLALGREGMEAFRAIGGPAADVSLLCTLMAISAVFCACGFSAPGTWITL